MAEQCANTSNTNDRLRFNQIDQRICGRRRKVHRGMQLSPHPLALNSFSRIWPMDMHISPNAINVKPDPYPRGPGHIELKEMITYVLICGLESLSKLKCFRLCLDIGHFWVLGFLGFGPA